MVARGLLRVTPVGDGIFRFVKPAVGAAKTLGAGNMIKSHRFSFLLEGGAGIRSPSNKPKRGRERRMLTHFYLF